MELFNINPLYNYVVRIKFPINVKFPDRVKRVVHLLDWGFKTTEEVGFRLHNRHIRPSLKAWNIRENPKFMTLKPAKIGNKVWQVPHGKVVFMPEDIFKLIAVGILDKERGRWIIKLD